jgi:hypothetical protein
LHLHIGARGGGLGGATDTPWLADTWMEGATVGVPLECWIGGCNTGGGVEEGAVALGWAGAARTAGGGG